MLYIHTLRDLNLKSADIESVSLMREIKQKNKIPISENEIIKEFSQFFVSKGDIETISEALDLIPETIEDIKKLPKNNPNYEQINLSRACSMLEELPVSLKKNLDYIKKIFEVQEMFVGQIATILKELPNLKTQKEREYYNNKINSIFERILRNKEDFVFKHDDIINEGKLVRIKDLVESMDNGFFFHKKLEEEVKKKKFEEIKQRLPENEVKQVENIQTKILKIEKGIQRAYDNNMMMINFVVLFYAYIKCLRGF